MIRFAIFTTTRAEFGLLSNLIDEIECSDSFDYTLFVGGGHHLPNQGRSKDEIIGKNYRFIEFDFLLNTDSKTSQAQSLSIEMFQLSAIFGANNFDYVVVLGDRIELLPIIQNAIIFQKPILHIHGGEITEGAIDDQIRHMITKAAHIHFCVAQQYAENIKKMGEEEWRVHNVGSLSVETFHDQPRVKKETIFSKYSLDPKLLTALLTYHPVTLEHEISIDQQISNVFDALDALKCQVLITAPNIDIGTSQLLEKIYERKSMSQNYVFIESLGFSNYHSMLNSVDFVIGNSSSGILEVPLYRIPTVNIGDRQKGRLRHKSVIDVDYSKTDIIKGIEKAIDPSFKKSLIDMKYLFGDGSAAKKILKVIESTEINQVLMRKKW